MRKLWLLLPAGVALAALMLRSQAIGRPDEPFGVLNTTPPAASSPAPGLPSGVEPLGGTAATKPANPFPLTPEAGQWLVCAAHFSGPDGFDLAVQSANELRTKHRLQSFIFNRGEKERQKQDEEWEEYKKRMHGAPVRRRLIRIEDEYAVLIGGQKDFDAATAMLAKVRAFPMPGLKAQSGRSPFAEMFYATKTETKVAKVNPYSQALVVRNPTAPNDGPSRPKFDPLLPRLNENEEYSLLRNRRKYTLLVKDYSGAMVVQSGPTAGGGGLLGMLGLGGDKGDTLSAAAAQAHELARFLRMPGNGMEAYVLHTRKSSMVTVGGFDSPTDPAILNVARSLDALRARQGGSDILGLIPNPLVMEVPRP